ncbi:putative N-acetylglucosaminyl-phosphatidylinositol de-N-acetylase [Hypsibius exemplaris]|uniref:N-acetylglucosaminylphosphatidylinositol deacetylase n=1 Tax=Hypsibius exemplaris TaxID=2072580 RepID=A0A1W0WKY8_HYPEX|nr:putative N-acetylglucosaminyl-phosphatidylinositol de-N-acetylase [Hypsibius exemplaris]
MQHIIKIKFLYFEIMIALLMVMALGVVIAWKTSSSFGKIPIVKRKLARTDRILVITAHPDDECMFFGPFILSAVQKWGATVAVLCCSTGNNEGKGVIRSKELLNACGELGVSADNVQCLDNSQLPDHSLKRWKFETLREVIQEKVSAFRPTVIATFDAHGVSGHRNHCDLADAVTAMQTNGHLPRGVRVLLLKSVSILRKYFKYADAALTIHLDFDLIALVNRENESVISRAMRAHRSQMVWFRWLYITFSRYMLVNTFDEIPEPERRTFRKAEHR